MREKVPVSVEAIQQWEKYFSDLFGACGVPLEGPPVMAMLRIALYQYYATGMSLEDTLKDVQVIWGSYPSRPELN